MADFELRGVSDMQTRLRSIDRNTREALSSGVEEEANMIVSKARSLVPIKSGELRDSIRVVKGELSQGRNTLGQFTEDSAVEVIVTAGNDSIPYTLAIHEHPSPHDPPSWEDVNVQFHPEGTGPKFLEGPLNEAISGMAQRVGSKVGSKLG
jgi:hypothetical protein